MRSEGNQYIDYKGRIQPAKAPRPCDCTRCRFKCSDKLPEEIRKAICKEYWGLSGFNRQKDFLLSTINMFDVKRRRVEEVDCQRRRKDHVRAYYFSKGEERIRVCKKFFMKTLCIGHTPIDTACMERGDYGTFVGEDHRGKNSNKTKEEVVAVVRTHIERFPKIESHYTRRDTRREYLNQSLNISKMYRLYMETFDAATDTPAVKESFYRKIFCTEYNLSFFHPKKDQCTICEKYKTLVGEAKEAFLEEYNQHIKPKHDAQQSKANDKARSTREDNFMSASFDLQSVLQLPCTAASQMYYSRKLCVYNLCVYNAAPPNNGFCYCWVEVEGGRGSNEIGTHLLEWINSLPHTVTEVTLYSDTCGGQNRNQNIAAMFMYADQHSTTLKCITHNFLESGHSHMECDSMHAAIEHEKRYVDVFTMLDWISIFGRARRRHPYKVKNFHYEDFYDFQKLAKDTMKKRRRDENIINWLLVKSFMYVKDQPGKLYYRYNYSDEYKIITVSGRGRYSSVTELLPAYRSKIPISQAS